MLFVCYSSTLIGQPLIGVSMELTRGRGLSEATATRQLQCRHIFGQVSSLNKSVQYVFPCLFSWVLENVCFPWGNIENSSGSMFSKHKPNRKSQLYQRWFLLQKWNDPCRIWIDIWSLGHPSSWWSAKHPSEACISDFPEFIGLSVNLLWNFLYRGFICQNLVESGLFLIQQLLWKSFSSNKTNESECQLKLPLRLFSSSPSSSSSVWEWVELFFIWFGWPKDPMSRKNLHTRFVKYYRSQTLETLKHLWIIPPILDRPDTGWHFISAPAAVKADGLQSEMQ